MPQRVTPTGRQKSIFMIHFVVFAIATIAMVMIHKEQGKEHWAYPWHAWVIAAWGLSLIGHWCAVYRSYEDAGHADYKRQENNG